MRGEFHFCRGCLDGFQVPQMALAFLAVKCGVEFICEPVVNIRQVPKMAMGLKVPLWREK
jgi:hypothetical protein